MRLEEDTDRLTSALGPLKSFVLPRGTRVAAELHVARAVARRAERELWALHESEPLSPSLLHWANRLSSLLFALALTENRAAHRAEIPPEYGA